MLHFKLENKYQHELNLTISMQQSLHVLELPLLELSEWLKSEIEKNPLLEYEEEQKGYFSPPLNSLPSNPVSLYESLMHQAREAFLTPKELSAAEEIIGNLDERGFVTAPCHAEILAKIQTFEPAGIAAADLRDSLLIQLRRLGKEKRLCYAIIEHHFDDFLHNRVPLLQKNLRCSLKEVKKAIYEEIRALDFHPGYRFRKEPVPHIYADAILKREEEEYSVEVNETLLPSFRVCHEKLKNAPKEERAFLDSYFTAAKWLQASLKRRKKTLEAIAHYVCKQQKEYLAGTSKQLIPMSVQEAAKELGVHESTINRAISHKYLLSQHGLLPLRHFFTHAIQSTSGEMISHQSLKEKLCKLIACENKQSPLSDETLCRHLRRLGLPCARRTIAKYRSSLNIPPAHLRRTW